MTAIGGEFLGTAVITLLGGGVVANCILEKTKGFNGGLIAITFGWAMAVFVGVYACTTMGGKGHLNPAVSIAMAWLGKISWNEALLFSAAQLGGAFTGAILNWLVYRNHFDATTDPGAQLGVFSTGPAIRQPLQNLLTEAIATFVLVLGALLMSAAEVKLGTLDALPVALLVLGIGLSLGGPTGYAINPARDLGPRLAHFFLPIKGKGSSDWGYAWVPVVGPVAGALIAAYVFSIL